MSTWQTNDMQWGERTVWDALNFSVVLRFNT
jgi:hypothetical protein